MPHFFIFLSSNNNFCVVIENRSKIRRSFDGGNVTIEAEQKMWEFSSEQSFPPSISSKKRRQQLERQQNQQWKQQPYCIIVFSLRYWTIDESSESEKLGTFLIAWSMANYCNDVKKKAKQKKESNKILWRSKKSIKRKIKKRRKKNLLFFFFF